MGGSRKIDITGKRFGRLLVLEEAGHQRAEIRWKCLCDCGNIAYFPGWDLRTGRIVSCGCKRKEGRPSNSFQYKNVGTQIYHAYVNMKTRCYNPHYYLYQHYGGKGITICDEWLGKDGFENFYNWSMTHGYSAGLSIDRIDNSKEYSPSNCRWATMTEQQNNRTNNRMITANGETHTMAEWSRLSNIRYETIQRRLSSGWSEQDAVTLRSSHASRRSRTSP